MAAVVREAEVVEGAVERVKSETFVEGIVRESYVRYNKMSLINLPSE